MVERHHLDFIEKTRDPNRFGRLAAKDVFNMLGLTSGDGFAPI
jgi:hypothetical protein